MSLWATNEATNSTAAVVLPMQKLWEDDERHRSLKYSPGSHKTRRK